MVQTGETVSYGPAAERVWGRGEWAVRTRWIRVHVLVRRTGVVWKGRNERSAERRMAGVAAEWAEAADDEGDGRRRQAEGGRWVKDGEWMTAGGG